MYVQLTLHRLIEMTTRFLELLNILKYDFGRNKKKTFIQFTANNIKNSLNFSTKDRRDSLLLCFINYA